MPQETLSIATLHELIGGAFGKSADARLKAIIADLHDRPELDKDRTLTLTFKLRPEAQVINKEVSLKSVATKCSSKAVIPEHAAVEWNMVPRGDDLLFATEDPTDPTQMDLEDARRAKAEQAKAGIVIPGTGLRMVAGHA